MTYSNITDSLNWYYKESSERIKLQQATEAGDVLEIIRLLFFEDKQIVFNGEEFVIV